MASKDGVVKRLNMELKKHLIKREDASSGQHEVEYGQVTESLDVKIPQSDNILEGRESMKEKLDFFINQCSCYEAEIKSLQEKMKEASELVQEKELQLVMFQGQEKSFIEEVKELKSAISGEKVLLKKLKKAEDALEVQRRRLLLKDQEILGYQRKLELALFVPQMGCALPQGEAWDLSMPRVKSEYQEQEQRYTFLTPYMNWTFKYVAVNSRLNFHGYLTLALSGYLVQNENTECQVQARSLNWHHQALPWTSRTPQDRFLRRRSRPRCSRRRKLLLIGLALLRPKQ